jgi:hypothetical protein
MSARLRGDRLSLPVSVVSREGDLRLTLKVKNLRA